MIAVDVSPQELPTGPRKSKFPRWGVVATPRSACARRKKGAYGQYSTAVRNGLAPTFMRCICGRKWEVILVWALSAPARLGRKVDNGELVLDRL